jgi:outer membrane protein OmpA-like peptidoglycan-associated protein
MIRGKVLDIAFRAVVLFAGLLVVGTTLAAEPVKVEGLITKRNGDVMTVKFSDSATLDFLLTDSTKVGQVKGLFKSRREDKSMAALIPGLKVKVEGTYNEQRKVVATKVSFKGDDLEDAQKIQAGLHETKRQAEENKAELERHNAELQAQNAALQQQQAQLTAHQEELAAHKAQIDAAVARFGQLDDYYILDELTVYFGNGKIKVDPKHIPQLLALADKAKGIDGYLIEVTGYASSVGSTELNQKMSDDRANAVTNILIQQGHVPLSRMLAPGAMGESNRVGNDKTAEGQAENRRVVVRVLQSKAVAGV